MKLVLSIHPNADHLDCNVLSYQQMISKICHDMGRCVNVIVDSWSIGMHVDRRLKGEAAAAEEVQKRLAAIPGPLAAALLPFQLEGVSWGAAHCGRVLIADEMGVGKTVQAIALASAYRVGAWTLSSSASAFILSSLGNHAVSR